MSAPDLARLLEVARHLIGRDAETALAALGLTLVDARTLAHELAVLDRQVAPAYLPLTSDAIGTIALYISPGVDAERSPLVFIERDEQQARWFAHALSQWARALIPLVLVGCDAATRARRLDALDRLGASMGHPSLSDPVRRRALTIDQRHWTAGFPALDQLWRDLGIEHPFAGFPWPDIWASASTALESLRAHVRARAHCPGELRALVASCANRAQVHPTRAEVCDVLASASWRQVDFSAKGKWRSRIVGKGLALWDETLSALPDPGALLEGSAFAALAAHPRAYAGDDPAGIRALERIASDRASEGDLIGAVTQARNALHVRVFRRSARGAALGRLAAYCEAIESDSLAACIARATAHATETGSL